MAKKHRYTTFKDLNEILKNQDFDEFKSANEQGRLSILEEKGFDINILRKGFYYASKNVVVMKEKNPFSDYPLVARLIHKPSNLLDKDKVEIQLMLSKSMDINSKPEDIFLCETTLYLEYEENEKLQSYIEKQKERERERVKQQNKSRDGSIAEAKEVWVKKQEEERENFLKKRNEEIKKEKAIEEIRKRAELEIRTSKLMGIINDRNIESLYHFTQIENLGSIMKHGIVPRNQLQAKQIRFHYTDTGRYDEMLNCSSVSIEFPNSKFLYNQSMTTNKTYVIIELEPHIITTHMCYFAKHNAASNEIKETISSRSEPRHFEEMFDSHIKVNLRYGTRSFDRYYLRNYPYLPTSEQAEILVRGIINVEDIRSIICTENEDVIKYVKQCVGDNNIIVTPNNNFFQTRDYLLKHGWFRER